MFASFSPRHLVLPLVCVLACSPEGEDSGVTDTVDSGEASDSGEPDTDSDTDTDADTGDTNVGEDITSPVPGAAGALTFSEVLDTEVTLSWTAATDDIDESADLSYQVYRSDSANIGTVADMVANGTAAGSAVRNITTLVVDGLTSGEELHLNVLVTDEAGNEAAYGATSTTTLFKRLEYSRYTWHDAGEADGYEAYIVNAEGRFSEIAAYTGIGADATWYTADDLQESLSLYRYDGALNTRVDEYTAPGSDAVWGTADDVPGDATVLTYDSNDQPDSRGKYDASGGLVRLEDFVSDVDGNQLSRFLYTSLGDDGVLGTTDDVCSFGTLNTYDSEGHRLTTSRVSGPGEDGIWQTADDEFSSHAAFEYNTAGLQTWQLNYSADGILEANIVSQSLYTYNTSGIWTSFEGWSDRGVDGVWGTADDVLSAKRTQEVDAAGLLTATISHDPSDFSVFRFYSTYEHNADGLVEVEWEFKSAGDDGVWRTADDRGQRYTRYTYDSRGNLSEERVYSAGDDGIFDTADDVLEDRFDIEPVYSAEPIESTTL